MYVCVYISFYCVCPLYSGKRRGDAEEEEEDMEVGVSAPAAAGRHGLGVKLVGDEGGEWREDECMEGKQ